MYIYRSTRVRVPAAKFLLRRTVFVVSFHLALLSPHFVPIFCFHLLFFSFFFCFFCAKFKCDMTLVLRILFHKNFFFASLDDDDSKEV